MTYRIKGWVKFQHFKDRRPPWIKLYRDILEDPDWHDLDGDTAPERTTRETAGPVDGGPR